MDDRQRLARGDEFQRYQDHNNDPADPRYRAFFQPLVSKIIDQESGYGLDYGAGPGSAMVAMLEEQGYSMEVFDPFYYPDPQVIDRPHIYDFLVCTEAMEHFYEPHKEFSRLVNLVKPGGSIYCMTLLYGPEIDFAKWHYRMDPTHVFFYQPETLEWIGQEFGLDLMNIDKSRAFCFQKYPWN